MIQVHQLCLVSLLNPKLGQPYCKYNPHSVLFIILHDPSVYIPTCPMDLYNPSFADPIFCLHREHWISGQLHFAFTWHSNMLRFIWCHQLSISMCLHTYLSSGSLPSLSSWSHCLLSLRTENIGFPSRCILLSPGNEKNKLITIVLYSEYCNPLFAIHELQ